MANYVVCFDGVPQPITIDTYSRIEALKIALTSFKRGCGEITVVEDPNLDLLKDNNVKQAAAAMGAKGGKVLSEAKIASNKENAKKAGRHYEYVIIGYQQDKRKVFGIGKSRKKDELLVNCKESYPDWDKIELILINKASKEDIEIAKRGVYIGQGYEIV